jgi:Flp pilus assembly protein TadG
MKRSLLRLVVDLCGSRQGAVAPTLALSLFGLIAAGGIAFDYARLAAMDTELQQAADQAALAAATQLDHADTARARAAIAIQAADSDDRLAANLTRFANDSEGTSIEIANITFCSAFDDSEADNADACTETTEDSDSRFVIVTTELRTANYALTPVVAAFSGSLQATAVAGVESSICNVAPLFVCTDDPNFPSDEDIGRGLLMKTGSQNSWAPGNYGLLDFGNGNPGVIDALLGHGLNGCLPTNETNTQPGNKEVTDAINTRLDVYDGNPTTNDPDTVCNATDGTGCPAKSARKDMVVKLVVEAKNSTSATPPAAAACPADPKAADAVFALPANPVKGLDRDTCHYTDTCGDGNFGDKVWDFGGYMAANHPAVDTDDVPKAGTTPTRYEVYLWELDNAGMLDSKSFVSTTSSQKQNGRWDHTVTTQCTYSEPMYGSTAYPDQKDRRIIPVVAANCAGLNGVGNADEDFTLIRVFDVFLTEPSGQRSYPGVTDNKEIYGEIIGPAQAFGGGGIQYYSRSKPYLVR